MYMQIESDATGYILIALSCFLVLIYLCFTTWIYKNGKPHMAEEMAIIERLKKSQKIIAQTKDDHKDSLWRILGS